MSNWLTSLRQCRHFGGHVTRCSPESRSRKPAEEGEPHLSPCAARSILTPPPERSAAALIPTQPSVLD